MILIIITLCMKFKEICINACCAQPRILRHTARYMEMEEFRDSDLHTGYFCYNCTYFMKPNHCAIVTDEGPDVYDKSSGQIAPYGICSLWEPNKEEMR